MNISCRKRRIFLRILKTLKTDSLDPRAWSSKTTFILALIESSASRKHCELFFSPRSIKLFSTLSSSFHDPTNHIAELCCETTNFKRQATYVRRPSDNYRKSLEAIDLCVRVVQTHDVFINHTKAFN